MTIRTGGTDGALECGLPPIGLVAGPSLFATLLCAALRPEGVDLAPDPTRPLALVIPPPTLGELSGSVWSERIAEIAPTVPMVVVAPPTTPVQHALADRVRTGRASILDSTTASVATIVSMLRLAADGRQVIDAPFTASASSPCSALLTESERAVLELMAAGLSNRAIAERRFVAERTIETHVRQIFQKLGLDDDPAVNRRVLVTRQFLTGEFGPR